MDRDLGARKLWKVAPILRAFVAAVLLGGIAITVFSAARQRVISAVPATDASGVAVSYGGVYKHLYVSDTSGNTIYKFPLLANGLPATTPDGSISETGPLGLAMGPNGGLYVSRGPHFVDVFPPNAASGSKPVRTLRVEGAPYWIAVTPTNYLYVCINEESVAVYRPDSKGKDRPLFTFKTGDGVLGLRTDDQGTLYALTQVYGVYVYLDRWSHGETQPPSKPDWILQANLSENTFFFDLAVRKDELYARFVPKFYGQWGESDFAVYPALARGFPKPLRKIFTKACAFSSAGITYGIDVNQGWLFEGCDTPTAVFVYDAERGGRQSPKVTLTTPLKSTFDVRVGP